MKKWTIPVAATLAAVLVAASQTARAGDRGDLHERFGRLLHGTGEVESVEAHLDAAAAKLELSASQRKEVAAVIAAALPGLEVRAQAVIQAHARQVQQVHAAELDEDAVRAASAQAGVAQGEFAVAAARLLRDVHRVLTPDQLERLAHLHRPDLQGSLAGHVRGLVQGAQAWADRQ